VDRRQLLAVALAALAPSRSGTAQSTGRASRIGVLVPGEPRATSSPAWAAFVAELRARGHVEGQTLELDPRFGRADPAQWPRVAADLVASAPDVIVVVGPALVRAAVNATSRIPIVMLAGSSDPVAEGLVASLSHPGGNLTGVTYAVSPERFGKQLEVLKEAVPRVTRVAVLWDIQPEIFERHWAPALGEAARRLRVLMLDPVSIQSAEELGAAFEAIRRRGADAVLVAAAGTAYTHRARIGALALQLRVPTIAAFREFPQAGGLMSYGPDLAHVYRRGAVYVDRILRGAKPAELPIEQPTRFEMVINRRTAEALGVAIPPSVLARADEVIE
jgi:putative ABC transport system substrate-binding protein